jgi:hypothetical protein
MRQQYDRSSSFAQVLLLSGATTWEIKEVWMHAWNWGWVQPKRNAAPAIRRDIFENNHFAVSPVGRVQEQTGYEFGRRWA